MNIDFKFNIGNTVYFINDPQQDAYLVIGFTIRPSGIIYLVRCVGIEDSAYEFELSVEKTIF